MALELSRKHLAKACEQIEVWGYKVFANHNPGGTGVAITLPPAKVGEFMTALAELIAEDGREDDAEDATHLVHTSPKGRAIKATWPGAVLTD